VMAFTVPRRRRVELIVFAGQKPKT
jgi:hypothetical protein